MLGFDKDNASDKISKGRLISVGENNGNSKLTRLKFLEIRWFDATGLYSYSKLGKMFGVDQAQIGRIITKENWK
jgi:hypothetical protein